MGEASIRLPNTTLGINFTNINNTKQCNPNVVTFKFNVSHWFVGGNSYMERAPYTFKYKINGSGPTGTSSFFTETITTNQQVINTTMPSVSSSAVITYTITDNKGCTDSGSFTIAMPTQTLSAYWSYNTIVTPSTKTLVTSGGFTPYSITPSVNSSKSVIQSVTVSDNVGCTFITPSSN